jgi:manganese transport protein
MLRPRPLATIGVALEHNQADSEILHRALSLAQPGQTALVLLHVVDTPITQVYGALAADRETGADERYLDDVVHGLESMGYTARPVLLHGPNPAAELVARLRREPVDLLVVGSHGHGMVRDLLYGQTVDKVRHNLDIPMLIARPGRTGSQIEPEIAGPPRTLSEPALIPNGTG